MMKTEINWDEIPEVITKEQLYQICHIGKATAQYLLQSGLIPCEYTGKQTRCYRIKKEDVITYLEQREIVPENYSATAGWYGGVYRQQMIENAPVDLLEDMRKFYEKKLVEYKDVISVPEIVILTGYGKTTVNRWCQKKKLKSFQKNGVNQVPKIYLIDFFCSQHFRTIVRKSRWHVRILNEFSRQGKSRRYSKTGGANNG